MAEITLNWYSHSTKFPERALDEIPKSLITAIDQGNAEFFAGFERPFPKTFAALLDASPVQLLESVEGSPATGDDPVYDALYSWALPLSKRTNLFARIPVFEPDSQVRKKALAKFLPHMPSGFSAFYQPYDGMSIGEDMVLSGRDVPPSFADWTPIYEFYPSRQLNEADPLTIMDQLESDDVRVVMMLRNGDFVLCNLESEDSVLEDSVLYVVRKDKTDEAQAIMESAAFDSYFAQCMREPEDPTITLRVAG